ncbi:MFS transporter [Lysinibacillus xylanilyticus]|uniref:MFS transporter n=1 Tax=Lysinibacillus xylanilyticus TaxID=582475 RepID=UPI0036DD31C8
MKNRFYFYLSGFFGNFYFERGIWILYLLHLKFSLYEIGILQAILNITMTVFELPSGIISDYLRRKKTLFLGHLFIILYMVIFVFSQDFWFLALGHVIYGIGLSLISGTEESYLYESYEKEGKVESYGKGIGIYVACVTAALALSMGLGGYLQLFSWHLIFYMGIFMHLLSLIFIFSLEDADIYEKSSKQSIKSILKDSYNVLRENTTLVYLIFALAIFSSIISVYFMYGQTLLFNLQIDIKEVGLIFSIISLLQIVTSLISSKISDKYNQRDTIFFILFIILIFYLVSLINNTYLVLLAFIVINTLYALFEPITSVLFNNEVKTNIRATLLSVINFATSLIMAIIFPLIGFIGEYVELNIVLVTVGISSLMVCFCCLFVYFKRKQPNRIVESNSSIDIS